MGPDLSSLENFDTFCSKPADGLQTLEDVRVVAFLVIRDPIFDGFSRLSNCRISLSKL